MSAVLLVEDDVSLATVITAALAQEGFSVTAVPGIAQRDAALNEGSFVVMLTDVKLADGDGIASLGPVAAAHPRLPIIILSAENTLDTAVRAAGAEAFEYFPKPFDLDALVSAVREAAARRAEGAGLGPAPAPALPLVGRSAPMQDVYRLIARAVQNDLSVLVLGESGTGKELVAEAIHQLGTRRAGPFVAVNAAAIPRDLIESELFGHEKGAFTGAVAQLAGKFEQADGGTFFLDEIGDMPAEAQTRLLRALQSGRIRRIGGREEIRVDTRIIAATNRDLAPLLANGAFREDLYYRLNVLPIALPPLRERLDDIPELAGHFLAQAAAEGLPSCELTAEALEALVVHQWPGNVRELRNVIFRLAALSRDALIDAAEVRSALGATRPQTPPAADLMAWVEQWLAIEKPTPGHWYQRASAAWERPLIAIALQQCHGNQLRAAALLGINRNTLRKRIADLGIEVHGG